MPSSSPVIAIPHASPPQSQSSSLSINSNGNINGSGVPPNNNINKSQSPIVHLQLTRKPRGNDSSSLLRIIAVAIVLVLAFHWYLVLHHVSYHAPKGHLGLPGWEEYERSSKRGQDDNDTDNDGASISISSGSASNNVNNNKDPYILSPACGGCYRTYVNSGNYCHDLIQQYLTKHENEHEQSTLYEASKHVGETVQECAVCNPDTCYKHLHSDANNNNSNNKNNPKSEYQTKYWRFDQTAPKYTNPTSLVLPSIPSNMRIPPHRYNDIETYIRTKYAHPDPENITHVFLNEYNPGLAVIPQHIRAYLPWNARYLLSLRVTPHNFCFPVSLTEALTEDIKQTMHSLNHLGLALLDENYKIVEGYDVVIDIDRQLKAKRDGYMGEPAFVDYRLFTLNNEMYLHINSDTVIMTKLRLRSTEEGVLGQRKDMPDPMEKINDRSEKQIVLKNLYGGDKLEVTLLHQFNTIWGEGRNAIFGKNYAMFTLPGSGEGEEGEGKGDDRIYAEMSVYPTHQVLQVYPDEHTPLPRDRKIKWRQRRNFKIDHIIQRRMKQNGNATVSEAEKGYKPIPSFFNADEHWFPGKMNPFKEFAHGGACCISLRLEEDVPKTDMAKRQLEGLEGDGVDSLFVGVGHTLVKYYTKNKLPPGLVPDTNYVSFLYAFDPRPPFKILARSGYFCLGFASPIAAEEGGVINPRSILTHNRPLQQNNETFACPQIHYIETIIEKADDPNSIVIGYGMNDCTARLVEVEKKEIARLLFPDPMEMVMTMP